MKGRRAWKKALAGILTGAMLIGSVSAVSASTSVDDVDASGWWVSHSASIELQDGTKTTITFNGQTYTDATETWDVPNCVVYTADEAFTGGSGISDLSGYVEYYVARADAYGWSVGDYGYFEVISSPEADNYDEWATYLEECKDGITGTITATLVGSTLVIDFVYGECETVFYITVDASKPVYLSLSGEYCTVTGISYDVEDVEWDVSVTLNDYEPFVDQEVTATVTITGNGIELTDLTNYYLWMWVDYWDDDHTDGITNFSEWYNGEEGKSFSKTFTANEAGNCYLDVELKDSSDTQIYKTSATATVTEASSLTDVTTTLPDIELGDAFTMNGQTVTLTFENGTTAEATFNSNSYTSCKGYYIYAQSIRDSDYQYYSTSSIYTAGTYYVDMEVYDSDWNSVGTYTFELTVDELYAENVDATALTLDESVAATIDGTGCQWYSYTCTEDDTYLFVSSDNEGDPYGILFVVDDEGKLSYVANDDDSAGSGNFAIKYALESGKTYYLKARQWSYTSTSTVTYDVTVTKAKAITSISLDSLAVSTFTQYQDYLHENGTTLTVTYADNTTATVTFNNISYAVDGYGNYIYYYLANGDAQYGARSDILVAPGTYTLSFYTYDTADGSEATADTTVTVVEGDITVIELLETEYTTTASGEDGDIWFAYTPATDGQYYFVSSAATTSTDYDFSIYNSLLYLNSDGNLSYVDPNQDESTGDIYYDFDSGRAYVYTLTAGTTYYFRCNYYDYSSDQVEATISVTAMQENHTHTYDDAIITWTWADDYSSATAVLRCDACANTVDLTAAVTSTTGDSSIVYTATVSYNDVSYTDTVEVAVSTESTEGTSETANTEDTEDTEDADTEEEDTEDADTEEEDAEDADSDEEDTEDADSDEDSDEETTVLEETTLTSTTAWSAITTSDLTVSGDSVTTYTITVDETYGSDWFSVEVYDADGNYITLNSDGTYWYYGTEGDDIVMTGSAITLEEGATYTVEIVRDGSDFTVTFYDEDGNELLSYYAANTNIDDTAATHVYAQVGSYTVSGEATGTAASLDNTAEEDSGEEENTDENTSDEGGSSDSDNTTGSSTVSDAPKTGDASLLLLALMAAFGCMITAISCKKKFLG